MVINYLLSGQFKPGNTTHMILKLRAICSVNSNGEASVDGNGNKLYRVLDLNILETILSNIDSRIANELPSRQINRFLDLLNDYRTAGKLEAELELNPDQEDFLLKVVRNHNYYPGVQLINYVTQSLNYIEDEIMGYRNACKTETEFKKPEASPEAV